MATSRERVRFYLPHRYFQGCRTSNGMSFKSCALILEGVFGLSEDDFRKLLARKRFNTHNGIYILCRPSQFARFIVLRYEADECINGVKDLAPQRVPKEPKVVNIAHVAKRKTGLTFETVGKVLEAIGLNPNSPADPAMIEKTTPVDYDATEYFGNCPLTFKELQLRGQGTRFENCFFEDNDTRPDWAKGMPVRTVFNHRCDNTDPNEEL